MFCGVRSNFDCVVVEVLVFHKVPYMAQVPDLSRSDRQHTTRIVIQREREREMDGWMVYCIINGLTITILWVNDDVFSKTKVMNKKKWIKRTLIIKRSCRIKRNQKYFL